jgi:hypothetical protein
MKWPAWIAPLAQTALRGVLTIVRDFDMQMTNHSGKPHVMKTFMNKNRPQRLSSKRRQLLKI